MYRRKAMYVGAYTLNIYLSLLSCLGIVRQFIYLKELSQIPPDAAQGPIPEDPTH